MFVIEVLQDMGWEYYTNTIILSDGYAETKWAAEYLQRSARLVDKSFDPPLIFLIHPSKKLEIFDIKWQEFGF